MNRCIISKAFLILVIHASQISTESEKKNIHYIVTYTNGIYDVSSENNEALN